MDCVVDSLVIVVSLSHTPLDSLQTYIHVLCVMTALVGGIVHVNWFSKSTRIPGPVTGSMGLLAVCLSSSPRTMSLTTELVDESSPTKIRLLMASVHTLAITLTNSFTH